MCDVGLGYSGRAEPPLDCEPPVLLILYIAFLVRRQVVKRLDDLNTEVAAEIESLEAAAAKDK